MKLSKSLIQISATALITSCLFIGYLMAFPNSTGIFAVGSSEDISWELATSLQSEYLEFKPLRVLYTEGGEEKKEDLRGFVFNALQLDTIINLNKSGKTPDEVYFMFGQNGTFKEGLLGIHKRGIIQLVAVGMLNKDLLITTTLPDTKISVYDKADPCPPNCPK